MRSALALSRDPAVVELHAAPGNPGTAALGTNHRVDPLDGHAVADLGDPSSASISSSSDPRRRWWRVLPMPYARRGIACFGPSAAAAQLEGSKAFAKQVMAAAGVPTARSRECVTRDQVDQALDRVRAALCGQGRWAGSRQGRRRDRVTGSWLLIMHCSCRRVVIEEFLDGPEVSLFGITDGRTVRALQPAQDFKRVGDGDTGPEHRRHGRVHAAAVGTG